MNRNVGEERETAFARHHSAVKALLHTQEVEQPKTAAVAIKAESFQDEDGVIIAVLSQAGVYDREQERALIPALKAATWRLAMKGGPPKGFNFNHEDPIGADLVGVYYDYDHDRTVVHIRPHDREIYEAAKAGEVSGLSWEGPYRLKDSA